MGHFGLSNTSSVKQTTPGRREKRNRNAFFSTGHRPPKSNRKYIGAGKQPRISLSKGLRHFSPSRDKVHGGPRDCVRRVPCSTPVRWISSHRGWSLTSLPPLAVVPSFKIWHRLGSGNELFVHGVLRFAFVCRPYVRRKRSRPSRPWKTETWNTWGKISELTVLSTTHGVFPEPQTREEEVSSRARIKLTV